MRPIIAATAITLSFIATSTARAAIDATSDFTSQPGTIYPNKYALKLHNTGTTDISTFWYAWDDSGLNFLNNYPYLISGPAGWTSQITYNYYNTYYISYGIEWYTNSNPVHAGNSLSGFGFESFDAPADLLGTSPVPPVNPGDSFFPVGTSFVYAAAPANPGDIPAGAGFQFVVGAAPVPEPATLAIFTLALATPLLRRSRSPRVRR